MGNMPSLDNLTQEQIEKLKSAKSAEELLEIAAEEEIEFTSEQLAAISGGSDDGPDYGDAAIELLGSF